MLQVARREVSLARAFRAAVSTPGQHARTLPGERAAPRVRQTFKMPTLSLARQSPPPPPARAHLAAATSIGARTGSRGPRKALLLVVPQWCSSWQTRSASTTAPTYSGHSRAAAATAARHVPHDYGPHLQRALEDCCRYGRKARPARTRAWIAGVLGRLVRGPNSLQTTARVWRPRANPHPTGASPWQNLYCKNGECVAWRQIFGAAGDDRSVETVGNEGPSSSSQGHASCACFRNHRQKHPPTRSHVLTNCQIPRRANVCVVCARCCVCVCVCRFACLSRWRSFVVAGLDGCNGGTSTSVLAYLRHLAHDRSPSSSRDERSLSRARQWPRPASFTRQCQPGMACVCRTARHACSTWLLYDFRNVGLW